MLCYCFFVSYRPSAFVGTPRAERSGVESFRLFSGELLVEFGNVVVPLGLVAGSCHRGSQAVLLPEALDLELAAAVSRPVGEDGLGAGQAAWLLIHQPHVPVETCGVQRQQVFKSCVKKHLLKLKNTLQIRDV